MDLKLKKAFVTNDKPDTLSVFMCDRKHNQKYMKEKPPVLPYTQKKFVECNCCKKAIDLNKGFYHCVICKQDHCVMCAKHRLAK